MLETHFDATFTAGLALREKQIQQSYRPIIGVHKWFARRPGTLFRNLLLAQYNGAMSAADSFFSAHELEGVIADPFMGGGTPLVEANRLGFHVVGVDINPMAWWIVRQEIVALDPMTLAAEASKVVNAVAEQVGHLYATACPGCGGLGPVKYFLWVKVQACPACGCDNDLFPGYLLAEKGRHPHHVLACRRCMALVELDRVPTAAEPATCPHCHGALFVDGPARHNKIACKACGTGFGYPLAKAGPPRSRMWALEYHCASCKAANRGRRLYKAPDPDDIALIIEAERLFRELEESLDIPGDAIPAGDETTRLHRWGYRYYREMFGPRQLLGLGLLQQAIRRVDDQESRHALLTVFSDSLRYQNRLCRYDTNALKCQDIFSVHGFPVGLIECENNLLGIPGVGGGGFGHFVAKYQRAKAYGLQPFETFQLGGRKWVRPIKGERIDACLVDHPPLGRGRQAHLVCGNAAEMPLAPASLDGVFTDPPYFANVQYAELMDFCYVWLRRSLGGEFPQFEAASTRTPDELTGNETLGRGLEPIPVS